MAGVWQRHVSFRIIHLSNIGQLFERLTDIFDSIKNLYQNKAKITRWLWSSFEILLECFKNSTAICSSTKFQPEKLTKIKVLLICILYLIFQQFCPWGRWQSNSWRNLTKAVGIAFSPKVGQNLNTFCS